MKLYINSLSPNSRKNWPKTDARYDIMRWMNWELAHWGRWISSYGFETFLRGMLGLGEPDQKAMAEAAGFIAKFGKVLDDHLADHNYLVGDSPTLEWHHGASSASISPASAIRGCLG